MEGGLPLPTKILIGATAVIGKGWWAILLGLVGLVVAVRQGRKTAAGKVLSDKVVLFAPIFGDLAQKSIISRFTRSTAALLSAGVPLLESLKVVRGLVGNSVMVAMVDNTIGGVTRGESLARKLSESPFFPSAMVHLIGVGERTGRLDEMFNRVAESFEKQTRQRIKMIVNLLTPILIICLAVGVAFIAIAILLPIFKMNQSIR
jgi:general secretion pathway protein F